MKTGVYPGTFDPITKGHLDIVTRATQHMVDHLIIAVASDTSKKTYFSLEERKKLVEHEVNQLPETIAKKIKVVAFEGLLIHFVKKCNSSMIIRGLRAITDFEYEFQMAGMNARMEPQIETTFLMAAEQYQFISSRFVKDIFRLGGDINEFVSKNVIDKLSEKSKKN